MTEVSEPDKLINYLGFRTERYKKGAEIVGYGDKPELIIVISGSAMTISEDWHGYRNVISRISDGGIFGAAYLFASHEITTRLVAEVDCEVAIVSASKIRSALPELAVSYATFLRNTLELISNNCVSFLEKIDHLSKRTTREKVLAYLRTQALRYGNREFTIPFSRQEFADYLAVDRSALSAELSRMQRDGIIEFKRSKFKLI